MLHFGDGRCSVSKSSYFAKGTSLPPRCPRETRARGQVPPLPRGYGAPGSNHTGHHTYGQGKSGKVRESKSTRVQKLTKDAEKNLNCCVQSAYNSSKFFLLALITDYLHVHF